MILLLQDQTTILWRPVYINRDSRSGIKLSFVLLLMVIVLSNISAASEANSERILDHPWDHSPITVYIDDSNVPEHYSRTYYTQIEKAMEYWEEIVTKAEDIRLFDDLDANILAMYCEMLSRRDVLQRMLYTHVANTFTMSEDVLKSLQAQERLIASYAEKLGLTPNARARLAKKVAEEPKPNKFAKFSG